MNLPKLNEKFSIRDLLFANDQKGFCGIFQYADECSIAIHRKSLRAPANMIILHPSDIKALAPPSSEKLRDQGIPGILDLKLTNKIYKKKYRVFELDDELMKGRGILALPGEGFQYSYEECDLLIPEINIEIATDERFFIGNIAFYGILILDKEDTND